jgi:[protein-PII] uridylyltransferase
LERDANNLDFGLKLGNALRTPEEAIDLAGVDRDTATSLLTVRHLAGDAGMTAAVADEALRRWRDADKQSLGWLRDAAA